ncbi:MAG: hypothetical protein GTO61_15115 [Gemmatimonadales bacterium]|nr:hypothetical protein [Gemmatimonadales bacterium]
MLASAAVTRLMESLLFDIQPLDPPTYAVVVVAVLGAATLAASAPSWRAAKLDATVALASE